MDNTDVLYRKGQVRFFLSTVAQATGYSLSVSWHQRTNTKLLNKLIRKVTELTLDSLEAMT